MISEIKLRLGKSRLNRTRAPKLEYVVAFVLNVVFYIFQTWPVSLHPMTSISGSQGDATGSIYDMWVANRLGHLVTDTYLNPYLGSPFGVKYPGSMNYSAALVVLPAQLIARITNELFAFNVLIFLGLTLPGFVTYVFFRRRGKTGPIAAFGALSFTLFPFHLIAGAGWTTLAQTWVIPLAMIAVDNFRSSPTWRSFWLVGAATFISIITNGYLGLMTVVTVVTCLAFDLFTASPRRWIASQFRRRQVKISFGLGLGIVGLVVPKALEVIRGTVHREAIELTTYGLRVTELVRPGPFRRFFTHMYDNVLLRDGHGSNLAELSQYVGYLTLLLALVGLLFKIRRREMTELSRNLLLLLILMWFAMSQGVAVLGKSLPVPAELIMKIAPVWRVYSRFGVVIMFVLVILAADGLDATSQLRMPNLLRHSVIGIASVVTIIDLAIVVPGGYSKFVTPEYVKYLSHKSGTVAMYPLSGYDDFLIYERRFWQRETELPTINGDHATDDFLISQGLQDYRARDAGSRLGALDVRWVVVDRFRLEDGTKWMPMDPALVEVWRDSKVSIFENRAKTVGALAWLSDGAFSMENVGLENAGNWIGARATISLVGPTNACVELTLHTSPYGIRDPLRIETNENVLTSTGTIKISTRLMGHAGEIDLTSPSGTTNIAGPDTRDVSYFVEIDDVTVTHTCDG